MKHRIGAGWIRLDAARRVLQLDGEVREIGVGTRAATQHVVESLVKELGAVAGGIAVDEAAGAPGGFRDSVVAGFEGPSRPAFEALVVKGASLNPAYAAFVAESLRSEAGSVVSRTRAELVAKQAWESSRWVNEHLRAGFLDHFLVSGVRSPANVLEGLALFRGRNDPPFTEHDRDVLHLAQDVWRVASLGPTAGRSTPKLAPRVAATLHELRSGASNKEIARRLDISTYTVQDYVKVIFEAYGVHSRAELLARLANRH